MNINEFREKYPQYKDIDDQTLANKFHDKYYSDMPKDQFMEKFLGSAQPATGGADRIPRSDGWLKTAARAAMPYMRPALEYGGALAGGTLAAPGNAVAPGVASLAGAGLGYAGGRAAANLLEEGIGIKKPQDLKSMALGTAGDVLTGASMEAGGPVIGKALGGAAKLIGKGARPALGALSGTGTGAVEEALTSGKRLTGNVFKSQTGFDKALRGELSGEDVVDTARAALNEIKNKRAVSYQAELEKLAEKKTQEINPIEIQKSVAEVLPKFVRVDQSGKIDWSRSALGPEKSESVKKIKEMVSILKNWGSRPGDKTATGLDMLKRQLDDFYSDSSNARAFVTSIRNAVKNTINKNFPEYEKMTKAYSDATNVIKDIESTLMMRRQGMSGRVVSDQTLRRLVSAMRNNFPLRRELVEMLGKQGGRDVAGQIAGHAMSEVAPRGIAGSGPALALEGIGAFLHPQFLPLLAASSPRLQGEFLRLFGKGLYEAQKISPAAYKALGYGIMQKNPEQKQDQLQGLKSLAGALDMASPAYAEGIIPKAGFPSNRVVARAMQSYLSGDYGQAVQGFEKAIEIDPKRAAQYLSAIKTIENETMGKKRLDKTKAAGKRFAFSPREQWADGI